jgi:hypothetical protein
MKKLKDLLSGILTKKKRFSESVRLVDVEAVRPVDGLFFKIDGQDRQVYEFVDPLSMATERFIAYMALNQEAVLRADLAFVNETLAEAMEQINTGKLAQAGYLVYTVLDAMNNISPFDHLLDIATVFFVVDGENPATYDHGLAEKKKEAMRAHQQSIFFLQKPSRKLEEAWAELARRHPKCFAGGGHQAGRRPARAWRAERLAHFQREHELALELAQGVPSEQAGLLARPVEDYFIVRDYFYKKHKPETPKETWPLSK